MPTDTTPDPRDMERMPEAQAIPERVPDKAEQHEVPAPDNVPPVNNPDPQPGDGKPKMPPSEDGKRQMPVELPGKPGMPERV
jgi:hypothetical protein